MESEGVPWSLNKLIKFSAEYNEWGFRKNRNTLPVVKIRVLSSTDSSAWSQTHYLITY